MMRLVPVVPTNHKHVSVLYYLLQQRQPHENISHESLPTFDEHAAFVKSKPYLAWYLVFDDNDILGSVYLSHRREIGIFLFNSSQGKGYGKQALELLMKCYPGDFYANIAPHNNASQRLFERMGFKHIQQTYLLKEVKHGRTEN